MKNVIYILKFIFKYLLLMRVRIEKTVYSLRTYFVKTINNLMKIHFIKKFVVFFLNDLRLGYKQHVN